MLLPAGCQRLDCPPGSLARPPRAGPPLVLPAPTSWLGQLPPYPKRGSKDSRQSPLSQQPWRSGCGSWLACDLAQPSPTPLLARWNQPARSQTGLRLPTAEPQPNHRQLSAGPRGPSRGPASHPRRATQPRRRAWRRHRPQPDSGVTTASTWAKAARQCKGSSPKAARLAVQSSRE